MPNDQNQKFSNQTQSVTEIAEHNIPANATDPGPGLNSGSDWIANCEIVYLQLADIKNAQNPVRKLKKNQIAKVERSVRAHKYLAPIILDENNEIVDGHIRVEVARNLGLPTIPCIRVDH